MTVNAFTIHHDDERRLAHRREKKRQLAEIEVKRLRLNELQTILRKLEADSEQAANQHSEQAGKLQAELDSLDAEHVAAIMAGKSASQKSIQRRSEIMAELTKLNQILETTCEANRRAAVPLRKQIEETRREVGIAGTVESELVRLAHPDIRRERHLINLQNLALDQVEVEIKRLTKIAEHNVHICVDLNKEPSKAVVFQEQLADYEWMSQNNAKLRIQLQRRDQELHRQALNE